MADGPYSEIALHPPTNNEYGLVSSTPAASSWDLAVGQNMNGKTGLREALGSDLLASVVVFLVALPLCMGIAIASGAPPAAGLITGIVGGLLTGALSGCPLQVSGPAAGLAVIVYELIQKHGIEMLGPIVMLAGLLQIAAGAARADRLSSARTGFRPPARARQVY